MKSKRKIGDEAEKRTAKKYGGKRTPNSGATWHSKGDVLTSELDLSLSGNFLIQNKFTEKKSFILKLQDILSTLDQADMEDRIGIMRVEFGGAGGVLIIPEEYFNSVPRECNCGRK